MKLSRLLGGLATALLTLAAGGYLWLAGSVVVIDERGGVESAFVTTSDGRTQALHRVWNGVFYTIPRLEGGILIQCSNGERAVTNYVTRHIHSRVRVTGRTPCARLQDD
jgi:hypothetical protein